MGNSARRHLVLLGDSTIDNGNWTTGACVTDQVRVKEPLTTRCARDGALMGAILQQAQQAPKDATHFVVSIGGNNAISAVNILKEPVSSAEEAIAKVYTFAQAFEAELAATIRALVQCIGAETPLVICSIYNPCFGPFNVTTVSQEVTNTCVAVLSDSILRVATRFRLPVIDWRRVMTKVEDFANPIEPSSIGGLKMADLIVSVVRNHPFHLQTTIVYPQDYPETELLSASSDPSLAYDELERNHQPCAEACGDAADSISTATTEVPISVLDVPASAAVVNDIRESATSSPS